MVNCSETFTNINNADIDLGYIKDENGNKVKLTSSNYGVFMKSKNRDVRISAFNNMSPIIQKLKSIYCICSSGPRCLIFS